MGYLVVASVLVVMVCVQVFHAGYAVLVSPGDWQPHTSLGHLFALPIMLMFALSIAGWMPYRFALVSLGLFGLYVLQYVFLHAWNPALHPVNALAVFTTALYAVRDSWRVVTAEWAPSGRSLLAVGLAVTALGAGWLALGSAAWKEGASLAAATEASLPVEYQRLQPPAADAKAVAAGRQLAEHRCIACHAADFRGKGKAADLTRSAATRSDQFLMWAISEGSRQGMPAWEEPLSEEERWQLVAFIKSLKQ